MRMRKIYVHLLVHRYKVVFIAPLFFRPRPLVFRPLPFGRFSPPGPHRAAAKSKLQPRNFGRFSPRAPCIAPPLCLAIIWHIGMLHPAWLLRTTRRLICKPLPF